MQAVLLDQPTYSTGIVASSNLEVLSIKKKDALRILADKDLKVTHFQSYIRHLEHVCTGCILDCLFNDMLACVSRDIILTHLLCVVLHFRTCRSMSSRGRLPGKRACKHLRKT